MAICGSRSIFEPPRGGLQNGGVFWCFGQGGEERLACRGLELMVGQDLRQ
jgi:hypothetical protein